MPELVVIVPTRGRPQALRPLAKLFAETTPTPHRIVFVCDPDDLASHDEARRAGDLLVALERLTYARKVNHGIRHSTEPLILVGADDIRPHPGWLEAATAHMSDAVGFVSLNDLGNAAVMAGDYATLPLVARWYADSQGELYHEGYQHGSCDVDASLQAKALGAFAYAPDAVMEHLHPDWGKGELDETYREGGHNAAKRRADKALLRTRWPDHRRAAAC